MQHFKESFLKQKSDVVTANYLLLFEGFCNLRVLKNEKRSYVSSMMKNINFSLNERKERCETLCLLLMIIPECDNSVLCEHGEKWFKLCSQHLKSNLRDYEKIPMLKIMTFVLRKCTDLKELRNKIAKANSSFLSYFYSSDMQGAIVEPAFECLYEYMSLFPGDCLKHRNDMEKFFCSFLNSPISTKESEVASAAKVFAALPISRGHVGESKEKGKQLMQLISLAHRGLDILFKGIPEHETYNFLTETAALPVDTLEAAKLLKEPVRLRLSASLIVANSLTFITTFLSASGSTFIEIAPKAILRLVFRLLQVEMKMVTRIAGQDMELLSLLLPPLQVRALAVLIRLLQKDQLVATVRAPNQGTKESSEDDDKSGRKLMPGVVVGQPLKVMAYKALTELIKISDGRHSIPIELASTIRKDLEITRSQITLKALRGSELSVNVKKKKKKGYSLSEDDLIKDDVVTDDEISKEIPLTMAALRLTHALFLHAHHSMPKDAVKVLRDVLLTLLQAPLVGVYSFSAVKVDFYRALLAYASYPHPMFPLPYNLLYQFLLTGSRGPCPDVHQLCTDGLATLSFIMANPQVSSLADFAKYQKDLGLSISGENVCNELSEVADSDENEEANCEEIVHHTPEDCEESVDDSDTEGTASHSDNYEEILVDSDSEEILNNGNDGGPDCEEIVDDSDCEEICSDSNEENSINEYTKENDLSIKEVECLLSDRNKVQDIGVIVDENEPLVVPSGEGCENEPLIVPSGEGCENAEIYCETEEKTVVENTKGKRKKESELINTKKIKKVDACVSMSDMLASFVAVGPDSD